MKSQIPAEIARPSAAPITAIVMDSARMIHRIAPGVKPRVFMIPISRTRSRTDMAIVLPDTSSRVNVTAPQTAIRNSFTLPR